MRNRILNQNEIEKKAKLGGDNHVFVVLDAVRYDLFDEMEFENMPNNALRACSPACWTLASFLTYFLDLSPIRAKPFEFSPDLDTPDWMPKALQDLGYHTEVHSGSGWMALHKHIFSRGFNVKDIEVEQNRLVDWSENWQPPSQEPFFSVFHVLETHNPTFDGEENHQLVKDREKNIKLLKDSLSYADEALGKIFDRLPEGTVVTLTADHGEALGEDDSWGHSPRAPPAKEDILGEKYRLNDMPKSVLNIPYSVGVKKDGEIQWKDPETLKL